jgi:hypothetical protein
MPDLGGLPALDVVIGLTFVFATLALIASGISELISRAFKLRAKNLEEGIRNLLNDPDGTGLANDVLSHPLIASLQRNGAPADTANDTKPASYVPSRVFAAALMDTIAPPPQPNQSRDLVQAARDNIDQIPNGPVREALQTLADDTRSGIDDFRTAIEGWYDDTMDRVSGWYKRRIQTILIVIGIALAIAFNVDAVQIGSTLWSNDAVRAGVVAQAEKAADQSPAGDPAGQIEAGAKTIQDLQALKLPIGWSDAGNDSADPRKLPGDAFGWLGKLLGILISGFAVSLGAPFWFDLMGRALSLRSSGKPATTGGGTS